VVVSFRNPFGDRGQAPADATMVPVGPPEMPVAAVQQLQAGPYLLEQQLGSGGESLVWLGTHTVNHSQAVVKVQRGDVFPTRMRREVAVLYALQAVRTPSVVQMLPAGADGALSHEPGVMRTWSGEELLYCVMERLPAEASRNVIKQGPLKRADVLAVCFAVRAALRMIHLDFQMIHNDLKPDNIVAWRDTRDGPLQVRLLDFGQAALLAPHPRWKLPCITPEPDLLYVYVYGSRPYMAPERWHGQLAYDQPDHSGQWSPAAVVDERCEQWSFAATVFELLTGKRLVNASSDEQCRRLIVSGAYLPVVQETRLPAAVKAALSKALALDPAGRYLPTPSVSGLDFFCRDLEAALA
jgi:serine/threonine protein kinase